MIALVHAIDMTAQPRHYGVAPFGNGGLTLAAGVDFFFVLSGFIISSAHLSDFGKPELLGSYIRKRFLRIYPAYWAVLALVATIYAVFPSLGEARQHSAAAFLPSITLLPFGNIMILGVAWTLQFEIMFYAMFALTIWRRSGIIALIAWFACVAAALPFWLNLSYPWSFFLNPRILEFGAGVAAAAYVSRHRVPAPLLVFAAGVIGFGASLVLVHTPAENAALPFTGTFGVASLFIVLGLVELERAGRVPQWRLFGAIGAVSYAI